MFVTFEGSEGSGKTTQAKKLAEHLTRNKIPFILTKEPGAPTVESCLKLRQMILDPDTDINRRTELFLYLADRSEHVKKCIQPALLDNKWVISDRYFDSTKIYQGIGRGLGIEEISPMIEYATRGIMPDVTFIMDVPSKLGVARARKNNKEFEGGDRLERESLEFHQRIRNGFLDLADSHSRYILLDTTKPKEELHKEIIRTFRFKFA